MPDKLSKELQALLKLPCVREPVLQEGHQVNTKNNVNHEALLLQSHGAVFADLCAHCARGEGPFTLCISALNQCHEACAACHYNGTESHCSHHRINVSKENVQVWENEQGSAKEVKKKSLGKKHSAAEDTGATVFKKQVVEQQMDIIESVDNHDIEILSLSVENETL
ncbi:hypothetical protein EMPG_14827 [Blastomyces silverae]|uniref:Uncharacterized protein n=1 Tax=Blastomyces silverae TaxID=2060906 RepID=A0A0H1BF41_9EURO|nr:hypothetical protein EMPG_14827 [Blastomyces silverae]